MFEDLYKARNPTTGEIKLFDSAVGMRLWLKENPNWRPVAK